MSFVYVLSVVYLIVLFLLFRKTEKKLCFFSSLIYSIGLLFCYNTFIVYMIYLLGINGSMLLYSLINFFIGTIMLLISFLKHKEIQKYYYDTKKMGIILCLGIIIFLIGCFKFRNFETISFESGDSAVHYRHALEFSENLSILDKNNSQDIIFNAFERVMPISYINCGLLFNVFSNIKLYKVFVYYNVGFLILGSLIFLITMFDLLEKQNKKYLHSLVISLIYVLAFPLNNYIMGFCYLSLSIMVINLLFLTMLRFKDSFNKNIIFKIIIILLLTFSCFYSYYQFVPAIYLALGLYYISLWRNKEISFKELLLYGIITLVIPFVIGCYYFLITWIIDKGVNGVTTLIGLWGYCYDNITTVYFFLALSSCIVFKLYKNRNNNKDKKNDYLKLNLYVISIYVGLFLMFYMYGVTDAYYFYKLFSVYWLVIFLYFIEKIIKFRKKIYSLAVVIFVINIFVYYNTDNEIFRFLKKTNIYTWNTFTFIDDRIIYDKEELEILDESEKYVDICKQNNRFLVIGSIEKNMWFYSITGLIPIYDNVEGDYTKVYRYGISDFNYWNRYYMTYDCAIYYYENREDTIDRDKFEVLYENNSGAIVKRIR